MQNLLFRQVHPTHHQKELSSGAFRPTPGDKGMLSVDCSNMTTAQNSYETHQKKTRVNKEGARVHLETIGTWTFSRDICAELSLAVSASPVIDVEHQPDNAAHHLVDFRSIPDDKTLRTVAKRLLSEANALGRMWPKP